MANFKHKVFLLIAKWIPVAVAAGILINNTLAMLDVKDVILDLFDITVGSSLAFIIMMYACSYVFNFCYWHIFSIEATKKIYDRRIRPLNKDITMWDVYVALNAQYHDNINLYEKWFPNATNNEIEDKIVEATISNWFEDEDASSDKVWEYFRVI